jgi:flagellar assembly factor FliW
MMEVFTTRFGPVEVQADDVIHFPEGLLGLEERRDWVLLAEDQNDAVAWLQSVDRADIALAVVSPRRFVPDYRMRVARRELDPLRLDQVRTARVLAIVGRTERSLALNLKAPVVINLPRRLGRQVIANGDLPVQYELGSLSTAMRKSA